VPPLELALLIAIVTAAFTVEAAIGFGATVVTVALASLLVPIEAVLPAFVPVNVLLSGTLAVRWREHVDGRTLVARVLPAMAIGMPIGMVAFRNLDEHALRLALGVFVTLLSILELTARGGGAGPARPLGRGPEALVLAAGGVVHGAFATGGPLVVYALGRRMASDKAAFRATLSLLWLVLNTVLVAGYVHDRTVTAASLALSAWMVPPLLVGLALGERLHRRASPEAFRRGVFALLLVVGLVLVGRAAVTLG
jgi:hypothetical protein